MLLEYTLSTGFGHPINKMGGNIAWEISVRMLLSKARDPWSLWVCVSHSENIPTTRPKTHREFSNDRTGHVPYIPHSWSTVSLKKKKGGRAHYVGGGVRQRV